ncbi:MAG: oligoendopeptidase F, partial [Alphaproteobacteria bacterium]|nr:oligoendopeptidase F [Alphaproteobacteria bacterium]
MMIDSRPVSSPAPQASANRDQALGDLPLWKLDDLYPGQTSAEFLGAVETAASDALAFETKWKGKLAEALETVGDASLAQALTEMDALEDLLGRIASYAGLTYYSDMTNPANGKFFGDIQAKLTDMSSRLLFFPLELNRLPDDAVDAAMDRDPALGHFRPWIVDLRKDKPFQLDDRIEQLFLEKSQTGAAAFNRLFDETLASLRFTIGNEEMPLESTLTLLQDADPDKRKQAAEALSKTFKDNIRIFTLVTNTLAKDKDISDRWRGFEDIADSRHLANRVEREVVDALVASVRAAYPRLSHRYYKMKARWFKKKTLAFWDRNAPLPFAAKSQIGWSDAKSTILKAYGDFSPQMADIAERFFTDRWIDAPVRPGKAPGAFSHPTTPSVHPYVLMNYQGKPRDVMTLA